MGQAVYIPQAKEEARRYLISFIKKMQDACMMQGLSMVSGNVDASILSELFN